MIAKKLAGTGLAGIGVLGLNFATGILVARSMGPAGRGEVVSLAAWIQTLAWVFGLGFVQAYTYLTAKRLYGLDDTFVTMLGSTALVGVAGWLAAFIALPLVFPAEATLARIASLAVPLIIANENLMAMAVGEGNFRTYNLYRLAQPLLTALSMLAIQFTTGLTVASALGCLYGASLLCTLGCGLLLAKTFGWGQFRRGIHREALSFGIRQHGSNLGAMVSKGLDIMLMPVFGIAIAQIGLYSVAGNLSYALLAVLASVATVVMPTAAGLDPAASAALVGKGLRIVLSAGSASLILAIAAPFFVRLMYGEVFLGAIPPLFILLPGVVLFAAAGVLSAGLQANNLPHCASIGQLSGLAVTVVGLALFLARFGIIAAAWVSLAAYGTTFIVSLYLLDRHTEFSAAKELSFNAIQRRLQPIKAP